jgi:RNA polymerase sigma-70 factor (ECF subfamily)
MNLFGQGSDQRLAHRAAAGDPAAWREIVDRFGPRIHAIAFHFSRDSDRAQDLTQEIFLRLFQNLASFRGDVPLLAWTLRLSRNLCIDDYRRRRLERSFRFLPLDTIDGLRDASDPAALAEHRQLLALVESALRELDPETALILALRDLEGLSYRELEALLDLPSGTVKSRLHRGRRELLQRLELLQSRAAPPDQAPPTQPGMARASAFLEVVPC